MNFSPSMSLRNSLLLLLGLLATGLLFAKCFGHGWTYDDTPVILANPDIRSLADFVADKYPGRPLRELSYWLDYTLWGLNPAGFMVQNLFWHGLCAGLLGCLLVRLGVGMRWALPGVLLFLSHPLTVEVAANAAHRKDSLCLAFILLAVICHLVACQAEKVSWRWFAGALAAFIIACLAKQHALLTPLLWAVVEVAIVPPERRIVARRVWTWQLLAGMGTVAGVVWFLFFGGEQRLQAGIATLLTKFNYLEPPTLATYYQMIAKALVFAVGKIVWPLTLAPEYTFAVPTGLLDPWVLSAVALLGFYLAGAVWMWRHQRRWLIFWAWVGIFWLPVANLWPLTYLVADRYLYTPLVGVVALLVLISSHLAERHRLPMIGLLMVLLVANAWLTWRQTDVWQSELTLWTHVSQVNPLSTSAFINLSVHAINVERDFAKGLVYAERAVAINERHPVARKNLAVALERLGQDTAALREYRRAYDLYEDKNNLLAREIRMILARNFGVFVP